MHCAPASFCIIMLCFLFLCVTPCCIVQAMLRGRSSGPDQIQVETISPEMLREAAQATEGFSGRELAKLMASMQAAVYGSATPTLTHEMWHRVLSMKAREHSQRQAFLEGHHTVR